MPFNNLLFPPYFPIRRNYISLPREDYSSVNNFIEKKEKNVEIIESSNKRNENKKEKKLPFDKIFSFLDLELDDLLIIGILFFLYIEKCDDLLLYGVLFLLLFDIELDSFFKFL